MIISVELSQRDDSFRVNNLNKTGLLLEEHATEQLRVVNVTTVGTNPLALPVSLLLRESSTICSLLGLEWPRTSSDSVVI